jgi:hypothetical protein
METHTKFEITVSGSRISARDWIRASKTSREELREQGLSTRDELAQAFAEQRILSRGRVFGERLEGIVAALGNEYRLVGLVAEPDKERWLVHVHTRLGVASVAVSEALVDNVIDSGALQDLDELKNHLRTWLSREDLIAPGSRNDVGR